MDYDISYDQIMGWDQDLRVLTERVAGPLFTRPEPQALLRRHSPDACQLSMPLV